MVIDRPIGGEVFLAYVREFLAPTLAQEISPSSLTWPACHKVEGVEEAIVATRCLYSTCAHTPDLNPIEKLFAKLKACSAGPTEFH